MKKCPKCNSTYTDQSLSYCLADGTQLVEISQQPPPTIAMSAENISQPTVIRQPKEKHGVMKWMIAGLVLGAFGVLAVGSIVMAFYFGSMSVGGNGDQTPTPAASPSVSVTPTPKPTASPTPEKPDNVNTDPETKRTPSQTTQIPLGRIDAPGDGFLALRSEPSDESGERLAKIPNGSYVEIQDCQKEQKIVSGKKGRWCMVTYENSTGWVFDAWLKRQY